MSVEKNYPTCQKEGGLREKRKREETWQTIGKTGMRKKTPLVGSTAGGELRRTETGNRI